MNRDICQDRIRYNDAIIIVALIFAPFTQLRLGLVGFTEALILLLLISVLLRRDRIRIRKSDDNFIFTKFIIIYISISLLGALSNYLFSKQISGTIQSFIFDLMAYIFVLITCYSVESTILSYSSNRIWKIVEKTYLFASISLLSLYLISLKSNSLFGYTINYYHLFQPFAANIHHVSMSIAPLPFIGFKLFMIQESKLKKFFLLMLIASNIITANATGSFKFSIGLIFGIIIFVFYSVYNKINDPYIRLLFVIGIAAIITIYVGKEFNTILSYSTELFSQEDIGSGRQILWGSSVKKILYAPIFGYGPGSHAQILSTSFSDAHQTFLTVGLQTGLIGLVLFTRLHVRIFRMIARDSFILASYIGILTYAIGGDILRRLPMWIFLILFYYFLRGRSIDQVSRLSKQYY